MDTLDTRSFVAPVTTAPTAGHAARTTAPLAPATGLRGWADRAFRVLAVLFALTILAQVAFAGGGVFGAMAWQVHAKLGAGIEVIALLTVVTALLARRERRDLVAVLVAFVFTLLQPASFLLASHVSSWFGLLHAADAVIIAAALVPLVHTLVRGRGRQGARRAAA